MVTLHTNPIPELYKDSVVASLQKQFSFKSVMQIPRLEKIVLSAGVSEAVQNKKALDSVLLGLSLIAGQKAVPTRAKKSIANFKLREGMPIGAKVTLRRQKMYDFMYRLIHVAIPRIKDFRGLNPNGFDGCGNFSMGIREHIIFPEIDYDKIDKIIGFNITFCTIAKTDEEAKALLEALQLPFRKQ